MNDEDVVAAGKCSAICCTLEVEGLPCDEKATEVVEGHHLCWVHARAYRNPNRSTKLKVCKPRGGYRDRRRH